MEIKFNVKQNTRAFELVNEINGWDLFKELCSRLTGGVGVSSPDMLNGLHCKQKQKTYELHCLKRSNATCTNSIHQRRGYICVVFTIE